MFVLLRAPNSLSLKEQMHEKAGRTDPSPDSKAKNSGYSKEAKSQRLDAIPEPPKPYPSPKHHTRENQASAHGKIKCTLNRGSSQTPLSIKPTTRPPYPPPATQGNPTNPTNLSTPHTQTATNMSRIILIPLHYAEYGRYNR